MSDQEKLLRIKQVEEITGMSRSTIYRMERGGLFPRRIKVSRRLVAWHDHAVTGWISQKCRAQSETITNAKKRGSKNGNS